jgi:DNA replication protein DnaC
MKLELIAGPVANCEIHGEYLTHHLVRPDGTPLLRGVHCTKCAELEAKKRNDEEKAREADARQARIELKFSQSGIPAAFADRTFENFIADTDEKRAALDACMRFAANFDRAVNRGTSLIFLGRIGTGKTHLAAAIAQTVLQRNRTVMYETAYEMVTRLRNSMRHDAKVSGSDLLDTYGTIDLLVIDEFGLQASTDDVKGHLTNVLDKRYRNGKPTVLISNFDTNGFVEYVGDRIADRLREIASAVFFPWESGREAARNRANF